MGRGTGTRGGVGHSKPACSEVFGALGHRWALEEPLTEEGLAELEGQIGVRLPDGYRTFLLHVAAGGAGPAYGLFPLRRIQSRWRWEGDGADLADLSTLAEPFPEQGPDPKSLDELLALRPEEEDFDEIKDFDDAIEAWDEQWDALMFAPGRTMRRHRDLSSGLCPAGVVDHQRHASGHDLVGWPGGRRRPGAAPRR